MKTYKIHLLRHGLTDANEEGTYIGKTDLPLSPEGLRQLLEARETFVYPRATRFFSSPLMRCRQTLEVLYPGSQPTLCPDLSECDFGQWEGRRVADLKYDETFQRWVEGSQKDIPGGESAAAFQARVQRGFEALVQEVLRSRDTDAVLCTHGGVIMMILAAYGLPRREMKEWLSAPGCGFTLRVTPSLWMREPVAEALCAIPWMPKQDTSAVSAD